MTHKEKNSLNSNRPDRLNIDAKLHQVEWDSEEKHQKKFQLFNHNFFSFKYPSPKSSLSSL